mmetsp:Transcript_13119/g.28476  ORF Transcript_13119/g.28476 Transcript_13119/m.28476 type:complete len:337 (+) Transcript_13119:28-1038(+)|eukprot:CAMPEP_0178510930 /NCGR_PEP_ID=MMETSP0696-20121128/22097_1 /TAXON_ID=265572 /ORGANISM="Extubocellulus spinifer, Strain CCMP396" /LENGTH=336 /DNA_ID=CAMNT_0020140681 /DNA_START=26 /DNA_END=1036 /DNA_ORIENTATION=+
MPRFCDTWVVDRTLFEFATGGSCACCGFSHLFYPNGLKGMIDDISDLETDAADAEFDAAKKSPWPPQMRDQVWADRVRLRHKMKKEMVQYRDFMKKVGGKEGLKQFLEEEVGPSTLWRIIQMPRTEVTEKVHSHYDIHSGLAIVLCAVIEQVANFEITAYPPDGRSETELAFENTLRYDRRGGFVMPVAVRNTETRKFDQMNDEALNVLVSTIESLGGPKLLHRAPKKRSSTAASSDDDDDDDTDGIEGGADDARHGEEVPVPGQTGPSFRSDRRIVRLLVARLWADQIIHKFEAIRKKKRKEAKKEAEEEAVNEHNESGGAASVANEIKSLTTNE